jgi:hypothetical protein
VKVKKKVKEKKGRSERPRIDEGREAIPSGVNFVVDGIDEGEKRLHLGNLGGGEGGDFGGGGAGEGVNHVDERENETFFGAVNFFFRFFSDFFSECGTFRASWNIFVEHFFLRGTFFFLDTRQARVPGQARFWGKFPTPPAHYIKPYIKPYILFTEPAYNSCVSAWYNNYIFLENCFCNFEAGSAHSVCLLRSEGRSAIRAASNYLRGPTVVHLFFHAATLPEKRRCASFFSFFFAFFFAEFACLRDIACQTSRRFRLPFASDFFSCKCARVTYSFPHETQSSLRWC